MWRWRRVVVWDSVRLVIDTNVCRWFRGVVESLSPKGVIISRSGFAEVGIKHSLDLLENVILARSSGQCY